MDHSSAQAPVWHTRSQNGSGQQQGQSQAQQTSSPQPAPALLTRPSKFATRRLRSNTALPRLSTPAASGTATPQGATQTGTSGTTSTLNAPAAGTIGSTLTPSQSNSGTGSYARQHRHSKSLHHHSHTRNYSTSQGKFSNLDTRYTSGANMPELSRKISKLREQGGSVIGSTHSLRDASGPSDAARAHAEAQQLAVWSAQLERERVLQEARDAELKSAFQGVLARSMDSTKKLDDVYYSILESLSALQSTIASLQHLSRETRSLRTNFQTDADAVASDVAANIDAHGAFTKQKLRATRYQSRITKSKEKTDALSERLEAARRRVAVLERQEADVQANISFQFRIIWGVLGAVAVVVVGLLVVHHLIPTRRHEWPVTRPMVSVPMPGREGRTSVALSAATQAETLASHTGLHTSRPTSDPRCLPFTTEPDNPLQKLLDHQQESETHLRLFDEL